MANEGCVDVALMTQFRAQRGLMQTLLDHQRAREALPHASTVHAFQGNEKAAVVFELTQSTGVPLWGWIKDTEEGSDGFRLFNVGLSRAQSNLILIANFEYLRNKLRPDTIGYRVTEYFLMHGAELPPRWFYPRLAASEVAQLLPDTAPSLSLNDGGVTAFNADTFYAAFQHDLANAVESVVILSPFMTAEGTARWMDLLEAKAREGVSVRFVTRPAEGLFAEEVKPVIPRLREAGMAVDERQKMHEKIAIIDGEVLWHGSLNILSHRDTDESMLRIKSSMASEQIALSFSTMMMKRQLREQGMWALAEQENPLCEKCGSHMTLRRSFHGVYFTCNRCEGKVDIRKAYRSAVAVAGEQDRPGNVRILL